MKTLVVPIHAPFECPIYDALSGICPGHYTADWLNALPDDHHEYTEQPQPITYGMIRRNWLNRDAHIVRVES